MKWVRYLNDLYFVWFICFFEIGLHFAIVQTDQEFGAIFLHLYTHRHRHTCINKSRTKHSLQRERLLLEAFIKEDSHFQKPARISYQQVSSDWVTSSSLSQSLKTTKSHRNFKAIRTLFLELRKRTIPCRAYDRTDRMKHQQ